MSAWESEEALQRFREIWRFRNVGEEFGGIEFEAQTQRS